MMDFIVLGIIPGTGLQITFGWVLAVLFVLSVFSFCFYELRRLRVATRSRYLAYLNQIAL